MPGFLSSRPNWVPPSPQPQVSVALPPPLGPTKGGDLLLTGKGAGGPNSAEGTDTLVLYVLYNPSTIGTYFTTKDDI